MVIGLRFHSSIILWRITSDPWKPSLSSMITVPEEDDDSALQQIEIQSFSITLLTLLLLLLFMYVCMYVSSWRCESSFTCIAVSLLILYSVSVFVLHILTSFTLWLSYCSKKLVSSKISNYIILNYD